MTRLSLYTALALLTAVACSRPSPEPEPRGAAQELSAPTSTPDADAPERAQLPSEPVEEEPPEDKDPEPPEALERLYTEEDTAREEAWTACEPAGDASAQTRCLLERRYAEDGDALALVLRLYDAQGTVAGLEDAHTRTVGWRGEIEFVPEPPVGEHRQQLEWVVEGLEDIDAFFVALAEHAESPIAYRHKPLMLKFFRSVDRTTPSAYARSWTVAWNVKGSLHKSATKVRETLFHEIFHLNDPGWSRRELSDTYDVIIERCTDARKKKLKTSCLKPYAPGKTKVKGSTYYAFHPGNGVHEYAAELALRYYQEQRAQIRGDTKKPKPFKCQTNANARVWTLMKDQFFGGVDLTPPCS